VACHQGRAGCRMTTNSLDRRPTAYCRTCEQNMAVWEWVALDRETREKAKSEEIVT
jgi:hypothetical protein